MTKKWIFSIDQWFPNWSKLLPWGNLQFFGGVMWNQNYNVVLYYK